MELGPASEINMKVDTDAKTIQVRPREKSEDTNKKETSSNSSKPADDAPDDEILREGNAKSAESESVGYTVVGERERNKHDAYKRRQ